MIFISKIKRSESLSIQSITFGVKKITNIVKINYYFLSK